MTDKEIQTAREVDLVELVDFLEIPYNQMSDHVKIVCPFHEEIQPSCSIWPDHVHCFGCNFHSDTIGFVQGLFKVDFKTAVQMLNKYANKR